jgi:hypothetical protein
VKPTEHIGKPSPLRLVVASLLRVATRGWLPRLGLACLVATVGVLVCGGAGAWAAKPETPQLELTFRGSTYLGFRGVLNPNHPGEAGIYEFLYRQSASECEGGGSSSGTSFGAQGEEVFATLEGLEPGKEYAVCLLAQAGVEKVLSPPVHVKTAIAPESPEAKPATEVTGASAALHGVLNPNAEGESGSYQFIYSSSATGCEVQFLTHETEPLPALGKAAEAVSATVAELLPRTTYTFCVRAINSVGEASLGAAETFTTTTAPVTVSEESVANLGATEVTVSARIASGGTPATYEVEYEPDKRTPAQGLAASTTAVTVSQRLVGLLPSTEYHFHFIAHSELGPAEGAEQTFTTAAILAGGGTTTVGCPNSTSSGFSPALPDCRAVELVSPATETGDVYDPGGVSARQDINTYRPFRAAGAGGELVFLADPGPVGGDGSASLNQGNEYLASRGPGSGTQGWETSNITPPVSEDENAGNERQYVSFSSDLSIGLVAAEDLLLAANPSPQGPSPHCSMLYSRNGGAGPAGDFHALFTETQTPGYCGDEHSARAGHDNSLIFAGESANHDHKLVQTPAALTPGATEAEGFGSNLYDSVGATLIPVNVLPEGAVDPNATFGGPSGLPSNPPDFSRDITADGSRVFWSAVGRGEGITGAAVARPQALYARNEPSSPSATTVELDIAQSGASGASGDGQFWTASSDGSKVFFTDCSRLTVDSTANSGEGCQHLVDTENQELHTGNDLYEYDFAKPVGERLTDVTVDHASGDALGADVQAVIGASEDGSYVYFVADGTLESGANARGEAPEVRTCERAVGEEGEKEEDGHLAAGLGCNVYMVHNNGREWERPRFIAALAGEDGGHAPTDFELNTPHDGIGQIYGDWLPDLGSRTAEISPDGRHLVFESTQQLTSFDTNGVGEVYLYNAGADSVSCVSCDPTGAAHPVRGTGLGAFPAYLPVSSSDTFMQRWMNNDGTEVFFNSEQPLATGDSNGRQDVYEWEAEGRPSCPSTVSVNGGCVFLLSGGQSSDRSFLVDVSESGGDVFLTHRGQLGGVGPQDDKVHMYDVRVDGGFPDTALACTGTGCQGVPPAPPQFATPSSATFTGAGNYPPASPAKGKTAAQTRAAHLAKALKTCRKKRARHKRAACERRARKRYGPPARKTSRLSSTTKAGQRRSK